MTYLHKIWHDDAENVSQVHWPLKSSVFNVQDGGRLNLLKNRCCIIMSYPDFSIITIAVVRHLGFLQLKVLTAV